MTPEQIKKEWDAFMEFPSADQSKVTSTSALIFARTIAEMSRKAALTAAIETIASSYKEWRPSTPPELSLLVVKLRRLRDE